MEISALTNFFVLLYSNIVIIDLVIKSA